MGNTVYHKDLTGADLHAGGAGEGFDIRVDDPDTGAWGAAEAGTVWFNSTDKQFRGWNGDSVVDLG